MFAKVSEVQVGTKLIADGGFTCIKEGAVLEVSQRDGGDLVVPCGCGAHALEGQLDDGDEYIGLTLA